MSFQVEFNELKSLLEGTVAKNPILTKEYEFLIFSNINATKNRLFKNCLKTEESYSKFITLVKDMVSSNNGHEVFMIDSFSSANEYDDNLKYATTLIANMDTMSRGEVISTLDGFNISYDIYRSVHTAYEEAGNNNPVNRILTHDLQYHINKIYLSNLKIILRILTSYRNTVDLTVKDLFSEGAIGLRRAIELFNCNLGIKFSTYASQWIKASINRAIADKDSLIRIPVNVREQLKEVEKIRKEFKAEFDREPAEEEVISRMKKKVSSLSNLDVSFAYYQIDINPRETSEDSKGNSQVNVSFEDNLIDTCILDESDTYTIKQLRSVIKDYVDSVENIAEQYYLKYHFGLNDVSEVKSKEEIINDLNIQPNEYDRIRKKALTNLKKALGRNKTLLDAYSIASGWESHSNLEF